jgi:hypothetical protein
MCRVSAGDAASSGTVTAKSLGSADPLKVQSIRDRRPESHNLSAVAPFGARFGRTLVEEAIFRHAGSKGSAMQAFRAASGGPIEVLPLVVVAQAFPARPSSLPRIRDFVRQRSGQSIFTEDDIRALGEQLEDALLDVAGPNGLIQVSVRIFPEHAEIDVLPATLVEPVVIAPLRANGGTVMAGTGLSGHNGAPANGANGAGVGANGAAVGVGANGAGVGANGNGNGNGKPTTVPDGTSTVVLAPPPEEGASAPARPVGPLPAGTFAEWFAGALRRESMTMEAAARRLQVSVKTVSRWVGGSTEPRLRDLSRIRAIFGEFPFQ